DYTFETCLHWLLGANPGRGMHALWREVFDIDTLRFVYREVFARIETEHGDYVDVYADVDRMEAQGAARRDGNPAFCVGRAPIRQFRATRSVRAVAAQLDNAGTHATVPPAAPA